MPQSEDVPVVTLDMFLVVPYSSDMSRTTIAPSQLGERVRIGATIRQLREMRGFRPDDFATEIGISRSYLANIEAGRKPLTEILLARITRALDVRPVTVVREDYFELPDVS